MSQWATLSEPRTPTTQGAGSEDELDELRSRPSANSSSSLTSSRPVQRSPARPPMDRNRPPSSVPAKRKNAPDDEHEARNGAPKRPRQSEPGRPLPPRPAPAQPSGSGNAQRQPEQSGSNRQRPIVRTIFVPKSRQDGRPNSQPRPPQRDRDRPFPRPAGHNAPRPPTGSDRPGPSAASSSAMRPPAPAGPRPPTTAAGPSRPRSSAVPPLGRPNAPSASRTAVPSRSSASTNTAGPSRPAISASQPARRRESPESSPSPPPPATQPARLTGVRPFPLADQVASVREKRRQSLKTNADGAIIISSSEDEAPTQNRRHTMPGRALLPHTRMEGDTLVIDDSDDEPTPAQTQPPPKQPAANPEDAQAPAANAATSSTVIDLTFSDNDDDNDQDGEDPLLLRPADDPMPFAASPSPPAFAPSPSPPAPPPPPSPPPRANPRAVTPAVHETTAEPSASTSRSPPAPPSPAQDQGPSPPVQPPSSPRRLTASPAKETVTESAAQSSNARAPAPGTTSAARAEVVDNTTDQPAPASTQALPSPSRSVQLPPSISTLYDDVMDDEPGEAVSVPATPVLASSAQAGLPPASPSTVAPPPSGNVAGPPAQSSTIPSKGTPGKPAAHYLKFYTAPVRAIDKDRAPRWLFLCKLCDSIRSIPRAEHQTVFNLSSMRSNMITNVSHHVREQHSGIDCEQLKDTTALQRAEEWTSARKFVAHPTGDWELFTNTTRKSTAAVDDVEPPSPLPAGPARAAIQDQDIAHLLSFWSEPRKVMVNTVPRWEFQCRSCISLRSVSRTERLETLAEEQHSLSEFKKLRLHTIKKHSQLWDNAAQPAAEATAEASGSLDDAMELDALDPALMEMDELEDDDWVVQSPVVEMQNFRAKLDLRSRTPTPPPPSPPPPPFVELYEEAAGAAASTSSNAANVPSETDSPNSPLVTAPAYEELPRHVDEPASATTMLPLPNPATDGVISTPAPAQTPARPGSAADTPLRTQPRSSASTRRVNPFASPTVFPAAKESTSTAKAKRVGAIEQYLSPMKRDVSSTPLKKDVSSTPFDEDREVSVALPSFVTPKVVVSSSLPPTSATVVPEPIGQKALVLFAAKEDTKVPGPSSDEESDVFGPTKTNERGSSPSIQVLSRQPSSPTSLADLLPPASIDSVIQEHSAMGTSFSCYEDSPGSSSEVQQLLEEDWPSALAPEEPAQPVSGVADSVGVFVGDIVFEAMSNFLQRRALEKEIMEAEASTSTPTSADDAFVTNIVLNDDVDMLDDNALALDIHPSPPAPTTSESVSPPPALGVDPAVSAALAVPNEPSLGVLAPALEAVTLADALGRQEPQDEENWRRRTRSRSRPSTDGETNSNDDVPLMRRLKRACHARVSDVPQVPPSAVQQVSPPDSTFDFGPLSDLSDSESLAGASRSKQLMLLSAAREIRWPAEEVDTLLYDVINNLHEHNQFDPSLRQIFEHVMAVNTMHDEPNAPPITIANTINDDPCPPWEFYYTNKLFYGQNVARGDPNKLKGCNCVGGCRPDSKTCACLRRQYRYFQSCDKSMPPGFNYDQNGQIVNARFPIFECNDACGCDETCMNRVVQNGRKFPVEIANTRYKGWGVFAKSDIPANSFIGIYAGELITDRESHARGDIYELFGRTYLFAVDLWYLQNAERRGYRRQYRPKTLAPDDHGEARPDDQMQSSTFVVDAFHVGNFTRFLNHCCDPNCVVVSVHINEPHIYKPYLCLFTSKEVKAGEELTFSYRGVTEEEITEGKKNKKGRRKRGVGLKGQCQCGARGCHGTLF